MLSDERFMSGAPAAVVDKERKKKADAEAKIAVIEQQLAGLRKCLARKKVDTKVNKNGKRKDKTEKKEIMPSNSGRGKD